MAHRRTTAPDGSSRLTVPLSGSLEVQPMRTREVGPAIPGVRKAGAIDGVIVARRRSTTTSKARFERLFEASAAHRVMR